MVINGVGYGYDGLIALCKEKAVCHDSAEWERDVYRFIGTWFDTSDIVCQWSSGTTGQKKKLLLPKKSMVASARNTCEFFGLKGGDTALLCLPVDYIAGKMMVVRAIFAKMNLVLAEPSGTPDLSGFENIDFCAMVPLQAMALIEKGHGLQKIRKLIIGGAEIHRDLERKLRGLSTEVFATYGMAETCSQVAIRMVNGARNALPYVAMAGIKLSIDERNCLVVGASYLDNPVVTNDVVQLVDNKTFCWRGRFDNLINSGGVKIVPEEIETIVSGKTGRDCAVLALPDKKLGHKVVLVIEEKGEKIAKETVMKMIRENISLHSRPKKIYFVERFPRNGNYKIDRAELLEQIGIINSNTPST